MNRISHLSASPDLPRQLCVCIIVLYSGCEPTKLTQVIISYYWSALQEIQLSYPLQVCKWKAWVLLENTVWTREERVIPNTGPSKPSSCFLSKHISSPPRSEQEKNICDPVLTHHNVTLTHGMRELLPGSLSVSLCNQSRRHCPKSRGVTFCCGAEFKADRQTGRPATLPELEREIRAPTATFYSLHEQGMICVSAPSLHVGCSLI